MTVSAFVRSALVRNALATAASFVGATVWTKLLSALVRRGRLGPHAARKVMHITTAPFFAATWPLYAATPAAAFFAASVPASFALRIWLRPGSDALVRAVARAEARDDGTDGDDGAKCGAALWRQASGPFSYAVSVAAVTALSWRGRAATYVALAALCFGDGMADVVGRAVDAARLPLPARLFWKKKTLPGSVALVASTVTTGAAWPRLVVGGGDAGVSLATVVWAAVASAVAEVFPVEDNVTVPAAALLVCLARRR